MKSTPLSHCLTVRIVALVSVLGFLCTSRRLSLARAGIWLLLGASVICAQSQTATTTALALTSGGEAVSTVPSGTVVTLTATVLGGSTPVEPGIVNFCDASVTYCTDVHLIASKHLIQAGAGIGTATVKFVPGPGAHSYKAVFVGTHYYSASTSTVSVVAVTLGQQPSTSTLALTGAAGDYTLTATVSGRGPTPPSGTVTFPDKQNKNTPVGTATLATGDMGLTWLTTQNPTQIGLMAVGDFNADGLSDIAVFDNTTMTMSILLGNGDGTFTAESGTVTLQHAVNQVMVGDFNGDGKTDLALFNNSVDSFTILLGNGNGTFKNGSTFSDFVDSWVPVAFAVADVNGDGIDDVVITHNDANSTVHLMLGNGDGTFTLSPNQPTLGGGNYMISVGDFNGDGNVDLVFYPYVLGSTMMIYLGDGTGTFTRGTSITPYGFMTCTIADFNGDGKLDIAVVHDIPGVPAGEPDTGVETYLGNGDGTFATPTSQSAAMSGLVSGATLGDFNGDGIPDLALQASDVFNDPMYLVLGIGDGTFALGTSPSPTIGGSGAVAGNFDEYGRSGLALPDENANSQGEQINGTLIVLPELAETASVTGISIPQFTGGHYVYADYSGDTNYTSSISATVGLSPVKTVPTVSWAAPAPIVYGTALGVTQLNATSTIAGTFTYTPALGAYPSAGAQTLTVTFHPSDTFDYTTATATVVINVSQATPSLAWTTPAAITYGAPLSAIQLNATATGTGPNSGVALPGIFIYTPAAGATPTAGQHTLSVTFTPTDSTDYTTAVTTVPLTVNKATPTITWVPAAITYGTGLGINQLNATATGLGTLASTAVPGIFSYSPFDGTVLTAGSHTLSVTFTPTDSADYNTATETAALTVNKATPVISWPQPAAIPYGTALNATQLDASATGLGAYVTTAVPGAFVYSPLAGTVLTAGTQTLSTTFTPTDTADYNAATRTTSLIVNNVAITVNCATPAAIPYGTALSITQFACSTSPTLPGSFTYSPGSGTVLTAGAHTITATFTPTDTTDFRTSTGTFVVTVNQAKPTITWATPAAIAYGTALGATQLDASSAEFGVFTYSPVAGTQLKAGVQTLSVTFTPTDTADYTTATATVSLTVNKPIPAISWPTPTAIPFGTALGASQLDATASLPGTFVYSPATGTVLQSGAQTLSVTFTPMDTADYTTATATVTLIVIPQLTVNISADDAGTASNCASGSSTACSLRDALAAAQSYGATISFAPTVFSTSNTAAQNTIILGSAGTMAIPANTAIIGATSGSGAKLTNLVTVSGNNTYGVFSVAAGVTGASISNLSIVGGNGQGGAINNSGSLTVNACTFANNGAASNQSTGGAVDNSGQLTVTDSTFTGNTSINAGGAIYSGQGATLTVDHSTFTGNTGGQGGAIFNGGSLTMTNSTISGNSGSGSDLFNVGVAHGGNIAWGGISTNECAGLGCYGSGTPYVTYLLVTGTEQQVNGVWDAGAITLNWSDTLGNQYSYTLDYGQYSTAGAIASNIGGGISNDVAGTSAEGIGPMVILELDNGASFATFNITNPSKSFTIQRVYQTLLDPGTGSVTQADSYLAPLGNYGGPTQTMIPLPGSTAICAGLISQIASGITFDQRGFGDTNIVYPGYSVDGPCVDAGAVQTDYALNFSTQPPAVATTLVPFRAAVTLEESGSTLNASSASVTLALIGPGSLLNGSATATAGIADYPDLITTLPGTNDSLSAGLLLNGTLAVGVISSGFNVMPAPTIIAASGQTVTYSPNAQTISLTAKVTSTAAVVNIGTVTFTLLQGSTTVGAAVTSATVANGMASVTYTLPPGNQVGTLTISAIYNPGGSFGASADTAHSLTIKQAAPLITWHTPATISAGTALSSTQLDATAAIAGNTVPGTFTYTPAIGAVPAAGTDTLSVTFTPADAADYLGASATVKQVVDTSASMTSPAAGSVLPGATVPFTWTAPVSATGYYLWIGTIGVGSNDIYNSAEKTANSYTFPAMPTNGETIYVRLITNFSGTWVSHDYTYIAFRQPAAITSPAQGVLLAGSSVTFNWTAAPGATGYYLWIGSTGQNSNDIYNSAEKTTTSYTFTRMPTNGETIYVRLSTNYNGTWVSSYYTYTAYRTPAAMISPAQGATFSGSSVTFNWNAPTGATGYYLWIGSTGQNSNNIYNSAEKTTTSYTITQMPTNGETIYVRLSTNYNGTWVSNYYTYTAQ